MMSMFVSIVVSGMSCKEFAKPELSREKVLHRLDVLVLPCDEGVHSGAVVGRQRLVDRLPHDLLHLALVERGEVHRGSGGSGSVATDLGDGGNRLAKGALDVLLERRRQLDQLGDDLVLVGD